MLLWLQNWASADNPMGKPVYHTYNQTDFDGFDDATLPYSKMFSGGIGKPNMSKNASPESKYWATNLDSLMLGPGQSLQIVFVWYVSTIRFICQKAYVRLYFKCFGRYSKVLI